MRGFTVEEADRYGDFVDSLFDTDEGGDSPSSAPAESCGALEWQNEHPTISEQGWYWYWHPDLREATPILVVWSADPKDYGWKYQPNQYAYPVQSDKEWWKPMGYGPEGPELPSEA